MYMYIIMNNELILKQKYRSFIILISLYTINQTNENKLKFPHENKLQFHSGQLHNRHSKREKNRKHTTNEINSSAHSPHILSNARAKRKKKLHVTYT